MTSTPRLSHAPVEGSAQLFTPEFLEYFIDLHDRFRPRTMAMRAQRAQMLEDALKRGSPPRHPPPSAATGDWQVPPLPEELKRPGIEISGPCSITPMFINALNPEPEGERAEGDLDDDEDSAGHRLVDTVRAACNRLAAVKRELTFYDPVKGRKYRLVDGELPFFMHRERGLHLDEPDVALDGVPVNAAILGTALTLFHAARAQAERGQGIYFYLPKLESADEARLYRDLFDVSRERLFFLRDAVIRAIILIESLPAVYQMQEMLHALGPYAAGLNAARWDLKASIFEYVMTDPASVWPDRFGVDIKTTPFLANIFRRLVAVCAKHRAVPIGGMATALPHPDPAVNRIAAEAIRADKEWEAEQGFVRAWVAHIFHMKTAADPFRQRHPLGWEPLQGPANLEQYPVRIQVPDGPVTLQGTRRNARMLVEYLEGWLVGRGAKGIDSLGGTPGLRPALMEDLATGRMSVAQIAQRIRHRVRTTDGSPVVHDFGVVKRLLQEETEDIMSRLESGADATSRYRSALKIALRWIRNYTDLNFRSLGSYTRADLDRLAADSDAF